MEAPSRRTRPGAARGRAGLVGTLAGCALLAPVALRAQAPAHADPQSADLLTVVDDTERGELTIALGPIDLPARAGHDEVEQMPVLEGTIPFDFSMYAYRVETVDADGAPVPQTVIHHANLLEPDSRELFLPIMRRIIAVGHETKPQEVPKQLAGVPFVGGRRFLVLAMVHNPTEQAYRGVSIRLVLKYTRQKPAMSVYPFHLDVMFPIGHKAFDIPPGRSKLSWVGIPAVEGRILGLGGHAHRYAVRLTLDNVSTGDTIYGVEPIRDEDGHIEEVPAQLLMDVPAAVLNPDHVYRVTVWYDNPTGRTILKDAMGSVAGAYMPTGEVSALEVDPEHALYLADYLEVMRSTGHHASHEGDGAL